jgi:hypothetical protein
METKAKRTLVKSAPELWELADDLARLEAWMGGMVGSGAPVSVEVTERVPERSLTWRGAGGALPVRLELELAERGFGTAVEITAYHVGEDPETVVALEGFLDELGSPDRRPFSTG